MPIEYCVSSELDLLYARYTGRMHLALFPDIYEIYLNDPLYRLGRPELIDMIGVTQFDLDYSQMRSILMGLVRALPKNCAPIPTHIIAPGDVAFGLARMYQQLADLAGILEVHVHRTSTEALDAQGLPYDSVAALLSDADFSPMRRGRIGT